MARCWSGMKPELHPMRPIRRRTLALTFVGAHIALVACYTFPRALVPERLRVIAQLYARPLFHQQWSLFAPDPPLCSCEVQVRRGAYAWRPIGQGSDGHMRRRVVRSVAYHVQAGVLAGDTVPSVGIVRAMRSLAPHGDNGPVEARTASHPEFRLVEHCVTDPARPAQRVERITHLRTP